MAVALLFFIFIGLPFLFVGYLLPRDKGSLGLLIVLGVLLGGLAGLFWFAANYRNGPNDLGLWLFIYFIACPVVLLDIIAAFVGWGRYTNENYSHDTKQ